MMYHSDVQYMVVLVCMCLRVWERETVTESERARDTLRKREIWASCEQIQTNEFSPHTCQVRAYILCRWYTN